MKELAQIKYDSVRHSCSKIGVLYLVEYVRHRLRLKNIRGLQLTFQEKLELAKYNLQLIQNAKKMVEHMSRACDFNTSKKPREEWWWHLDQIAEENLPFGVTSLVHGKVI